MRTMESGDAERLETVARAVSDKLSGRFEDQAARLDQDFARQSERIEQRLTAADDRHAIALEKLGGEIARISDRLSERISKSERRSAQALEDIGRRLAESSDRIEQRYDRASGELAERMRMSEERTARLLAEARDSMEARAPTAVRDMPLDSPEPALGGAIERPMGDWRAAAFGFRRVIFDRPNMPIGESLGERLQARVSTICGSYSTCGGEEDSCVGAEADVDGSMDAPAEPA